MDGNVRKIGENMMKLQRMKRMIYECYRFKSLIYELVSRDIKVKYRRSVLGLLWTMLVPIFTMLIMTVVFSRLFRFQIENYVVYLLCGNILFSFFSEGTSSGLSSIVDNSSLIKKVYIPKCIFPISKVVSAAINLFFATLALIVVMLITGTSFYWTMLLIPIVVLYLFIFTAGIGMILSSLTIFFRDMVHLFGVVITMWMYTTPIFYPASLLQDNAPFLLKINPMYYYIHYMRQLVLEGVAPGIYDNLICLSFGIIPFLCGLYTISENQDKYILYI
jgi:ABC-2 type transport system permease protein